MTLLSNSNWIVVGVDGSPASDVAVRWAAAEAGRSSRSVRLTHCVWADAIAYSAGFAGLEALFPQGIEFGRSALAEAAAIVRHADPGLATTSALRMGNPATVLVEESSDARMVVVGRHEAGPLADVLGSTAYGLVRRAACPVAIVPQGWSGVDNTGAGPVVVGVDGSRFTDAAVAVAFEEAAERSAPLVALHVWSDLDAAGLDRLVDNEVVWPDIDAQQHRVLAEQLAGWSEKYPDVRVERVVLRERPRDALLEWSSTAQLMVVGSRGRGGFRRMLLGSTSHALAEHAECPVLIVRG